jgi:hypothetical protein
MHEFELKYGEIVKIGGYPFLYLGNGRFAGAVDPVHARGVRDEKRCALKPAEPIKRD